MTPAGFKRQDHATSTYDGCTLSPFPSIPMPYDADNFGFHSWGADKPRKGFRQPRTGKHAKGKR